MAELGGETSSKVSTCLVPCMLRQATVLQLPQMFHGPKKIARKKDRAGTRDEDNEYLCVVRWDKFHDAIASYWRRTCYDLGPQSRCSLRFWGSLSSIFPSIFFFTFFFLLPSSSSCHFLFLLACLELFSKCIYIYIYKKGILKKEILNKCRYNRNVTIYRGLFNL